MSTCRSAYRSMSTIEVHIEVCLHIEVHIEACLHIEVSCLHIEVKYVI